MPVHRILLAAALGAAVAPPLAALPAAAAPSCANLSGSASADLVRVQALDPHALRPGQSPVGLRLASARADLSATRTTATARNLDAPLPVPVPTGTVTQQAPPAPSKSGTQAASAPVDIGITRIGTGDLRAKAGWPEGSGCGAASSGPVASSSAALADATVLPGVGGRNLLHAPRNLSSGADAGLTLRDRHVATTVTARAGLAELRLFEGTNEPVQIRVVTAATLSATAGGSVARSSVRYTSPLVEVHRPNGITQTLDAPAKTMDIPLTPATLGAFGLGGGAAVLRLSIGTVSQRITATAVTAEAATLRVQLLGGTGTGPTLVDLGIGVLQTKATAPTEAAPASTPGGSLPVTGLDVRWLLGIGVLVAISGRLLLVLSRRRSASAELPR